MITKEAIEAAMDAYREGIYLTDDQALASVTAILTAAFAAMPGPAVKVKCPCTTFEQDEDCPVGYPSMLCRACDGTGLTDAETVSALAAEMLKVAEQVDELEDPFSAWETIELLKSQQPAPDLASENERLRAALEEVMSWVKNWGVPFLEDDEWSDTAAKVCAALERT